MPYYLLNQFRVESDLTLPCPAADAPSSTAVPLTIRYAPDTLHEFTRVAWAGRRGGSALRAYDVGDGLLVCAYDKVKMLVERQGQGLTFDFDGQDAFASALAQALAINLGLSLCTLLRGELALHGAGVELNGKFIVLMAPSGTGKSTLLWSLLDAGARFASDDVVPVCVSSLGVTAFPSVSLPSKLSSSALAGRGLEPAAYCPVLPDDDEFWIPIAAQNRLLKPRPLDALFVLQPFQQPELPNQIQVSRQVGASTLGLLMANTQGLWAAQSLLNGPDVLRQYQALTARVPLYVLSYHRQYEMLTPLRNVISELLAAPPEAAPILLPPVRRRWSLRTFANQGSKART